MAEYGAIHKSKVVWLSNVDCKSKTKLIFEIGYRSELLIRFLSLLESMRSHIYIYIYTYLLFFTIHLIIIKKKRAGMEQRIVSWDDSEQDQRRTTIHT